MKRFNYFLIVAVCTFVLIMSHGLSSASTVLSEVDRGWYDDTGFHLTGNTNYLVGDNGGVEHRNWFVFDLSGVTQTILSATLKLDNTAYQSPDSTETYSIFDVTTNLSTLMGGTGGTSAFTDLGSGTSYGSYNLSSSDDGSIVSITLNGSAISALNSATGNFGFGGAITTISALGGPAEHAFGSTGGSSYSTQLEVTVVPEPVSSALFVIGAATLGFSAYRKKKMIKNEIA